MANQIFSGQNIQRTPGCVVVQTCDSYQRFWNSFFWSFYKYWDRNISWPIYFCNEEIEVNMPGFSQGRTGKGSHSDRMRRILASLPEYEYVFYLLEDFWLTDPMTKEMFDGLFSMVKENNWDSLRVATHQPAYYKVEPTEHRFQGQRILKFAKDSDWQYSQQAAFWKREFLLKCIVEPEISEVEVSSSITGEVAMDHFLRKNFPDSQIYLYNYNWYPVSGAVWRGKLTQMGEQIEFLRQVDQVVKDFN